MPRAKSKQPTDAEMEILKILWDEGPSELGAICARLRENRSVATTTVATMLKVMLEKRLVERTGETRSFVWAARVSRAATQQGMVGRLVDFVFDGSAKGLVAHLIEQGDLGERERAEILRMLAASDDEAKAAAADDSDEEVRP